MEQVGAEPAVAHRDFQIDVRRGNDPHVDRNRFASAEPLDLAFLQKAQQARLALERQVADFVEQQRAAVGGFDATDLALIRAGERAAFIAE
jgi:hypothetical protein